VFLDAVKYVVALATMVEVSPQRRQRELVWSGRPRNPAAGCSSG
jgi:hypothetical protein